MLPLLLLLGPSSAEDDVTTRESAFTLPPPWRNNTCTPARECDACLRTPECTWCKEVDWRGPRCDLRKW